MLLVEVVARRVLPLLPAAVEARLVAEAAPAVAAVHQVVVAAAGVEPAVALPQTSRLSAAPYLRQPRGAAPCSFVA